MDSISFQVGSPANHDEIVEFLNLHFLPHEPMNISISLVEPGYTIPYFEAMVRRHLREEGSLALMARQRNVLMGLAVFVTERHGDKAEEDSDLVCPSKLTSIFQFIDGMKSKLDVAGQYGVSQWAEVEGFKRLRCKGSKEEFNHTMFFESDRSKSELLLECLENGAYAHVDEWPVCLQGVLDIEYD